MTTLVLIDAYNAMYRLLPDLPEDRDEARRRLVALVREAARGRAHRLHLVFDTLPGAARAGVRGRTGSVSWHYPAGSADDEILDHLRRNEGRAGGPSVLVVTNDRELAGRARQLGARTIGVDAFFAAPPGPGTSGEPPRARPPVGGRPFRADDFGLPEGPIDLDDDV